MRLITRKSFARKASTSEAAALGGNPRNLRYTEVVNQFETVETDPEGTPDIVPAESLVFFQSLHFDR